MCIQVGIECVDHVPVANLRRREDLEDQKNVKIVLKVKAPHLGHLPATTVLQGSILPWGAKKHAWKFAVICNLCMHVPTTLLVPGRSFEVYLMNFL